MFDLIAVIIAIVLLVTVFIINRRLRQQTRQMQSVKKSVSHYTTAIDQIGIGHMLVDEDYYIREMNSTMINWFGDQRGNTCFESISGSASPCTCCGVREASHTGGPARCQITIPDGRRFDIISTSMQNSAGDKHTMLFYRDISVSKRAEAERRAAQDMQHRILEMAATAVFTVDTNRIITKANREFCKLTGFTEAEVVGQHCHILRGEPCMNKCGLYDPSRTEPIFSKQCKVETKNGQSLTILKNSDLLHDEAGNVTGGIESFLDVTELVSARELAEDTNSQLEQVLERANRMAVRAEMASAAKSVFLANMSHEIRTPMNGVIGMIGLLLETELTADQRQFADIVRKSAESLLTLINDILDFSKIEAGKLEMEIIDFDLRTLFEDFGDTIAMRAHEKELELNCLISANVPSRLEGDPGRLRQVLMNLAGNAIKFTSHGEVTIVAELNSEDDTAAELRFSVRDTGTGIPAERQDMLFNAFTQVDASTTREYGGTGLGLSISRQLVEMMHGQIGVESVSGAGSTFWFTARFVKQKEVAHPLAISNSDTDTLVESKRILVAESNETNRLAMGGMLEQWGFDHCEVADGYAAIKTLELAAAQGKPFQVAILNMQLPEMEGEQLAKNIVAAPSLSATRLIMMAAIGKRGDGTRMKEIGIDGYLTKPIKQMMLFDCLAMVLARKARGGYRVAQPLVTRHTLAETQRTKVKILLAEDNHVNQMVAVGILKKLGFEADTVNNGAEAVKALAATQYDLVLMDCQMPVMDGYKATRTIRDPQSAVIDHNVRIVAMTANAMAGDREKCLAAGMDDYVAKPIRPEELLAAIERGIETNDSQRKTA